MTEDMSDKRWVYHATEEAKIVTGEEAERLYGQGWADTPAAFKKSEAIKTIKDDFNGGGDGNEPEEDDPTEEVEEPTTEDETEDETPDGDAGDSDTDTVKDPEETPTDDSEGPESDSHDADGQPNPPQPVSTKPLSQMNVETLKIVAEAEGIVFSEGVTTKEQMRNAITVHRNAR